VQEKLSVTPDQTMAFGDFLNDLEMMDAATWSFAMANAHPLLKERAEGRAREQRERGGDDSHRSRPGDREPQNGSTVPPPLTSQPGRALSRRVEAVADVSRRTARHFAASIVEVR
jgi:hypothetical protein